VSFCVSELVFHQYLPVWQTCLLGLEECYQLVNARVLRAMAIIWDENSSLLSVREAVDLIAEQKERRTPAARRMELLGLCRLRLTRRDWKVSSRMLECVEGLRRYRLRCDMPLLAFCREHFEVKR
jgi:hypothetical protein